MTPDDRIPVQRSLFASLLERRPSGRVTRASKGTLVVSSHLIEELVAASPDRTVLISGFQHGRHWAVERDKYLRLAGAHDVIAVFAGEPPPATWETEHVGVRLEAGDPLTQEWFVLAVGPQLTVTLCGLDAGSRAEPLDDPPADDSDRLFDVIWSFDPETARDALEVVLAAVEESAPERSAEVRHAVARAGDDMPSAEDVAASADHLVSGLVSRLELARSREITAVRRTSEAKNVFLSRMSHELRTPLNAILGFTQLLQLSEHADEESLGQIAAAGRHLLGLIDEVVDIARIEEERLELSLEPVHVAVTVGDAVALVEPLAGARGISVEIEAPLELQLLGDEQRVRQILLNLLSNAVKYNAEGGRIRVTATEGRERIRIAVSDTGPGISPEGLQRLFQPFERLGAREAEGTGLGLTISQRLAVAMGGRIEVESRVGGGSTFALVLPAHAAVPAGPPARVLHVEDDESNALLVRRALEQHSGVVVRSVGSVAEAGREIWPVPPALVLLDLDLPDGSGLDLLRELRARPETAGTPVIVVTADATEVTRRRVLEEGADDLLTKPLDLQRLLRVIKSALVPRRSS